MYIKEIGKASSPYRIEPDPFSHPFPMYEFVCDGDENNCSRCRELDGKVFYHHQAVEGENYPPLHPNCRCRTKESALLLPGLIDFSKPPEGFENLENLTSTRNSTVELIRMLSNTNPRSIPKEDKRIISRINELFSEFGKQLMESMALRAKLNEIEVAYYTEVGKVINETLQYLLDDIVDAAKRDITDISTSVTHHVLGALSAIIALKPEAVIPTLETIRDIMLDLPHLDKTAEENYNYNRQIPFRGLIHNQVTDPNASQIRVGHALSDNAGCGWIATYNALHLLGQPEHPADVVRYYEENGGMNMYGFLGINPVVVAEYMQEQGLDVQIAHGQQASLDDMIRGSSVSILTYVHSSALHFIAVEFDEETGMFHAYNADSHSDKEKELLSIDEWLRDNHYTALSIITAAQSPIGWYDDMPGAVEHI